LMSDVAYDLAVIGGGINGCGIARDAQGRGLSVFLAEMGDLGGATSSASTKLIHGGLRYLESYKFGYVREALAEREVLLNSAPHLIRPFRFIIPRHTDLRSWPVLRLGLFVYDHLGGRHTLPPTRTIDLNRDPAGARLKSVHRRAFEYSDCLVDDARLVVMNARDAADRGAEIRTRVRCVSVCREVGVWRVALVDQRDAKPFQISARAIVNAAGPWVSAFLSDTTDICLRSPVRLVKGSHIVVDQVFDRDRAYTFQNPDGRVCFAIPFEHDFTLIGSTDQDFDGDPATATISEAETDYLLTAVNRYLQRPITRQMIRWTYAGVRPLVDDGAAKAQEVTREYLLERDAPAGEAPLLSVVGGKITTYRRLAEKALDQLADAFPRMRPAWTSSAKLPGGDILPTALDDWAEGIAHRHGSLDPDLIRRLCRSYGSQVDELLSGVSTAADLGRQFGAGLSQHEVDYLTSREWAETAEDILWRRSKLGLRFTPEQRAELETYLQPRGHISGLFAGEGPPR
jgi:glycerol-3-phosphate dehydrogenase